MKASDKEVYLVNSIHPASIKHALKGHPWITKDAYSSKWAKDKNLLQVKLSTDKTYTYIHDPNHAFCVARLIAPFKISSEVDFHQLIIERILQAIQIRKDKSYISKRNHFWLVFAEADQLPGLYINYLNGHIVIQTHIEYWEKHLPFLMEAINQAVLQSNLKFEKYWWQKRSQGQHLPMCFIDNKFQPSDKTFWVEEDGFKMQVNLGARYDYGIYTDMASIREMLSLDKKILKTKVF
jgi:23S rRNA (cytosine1962-C5)-methyltransferase